MTKLEAFESQDVTSRGIGRDCHVIGKLGAQHRPILGIFPLKGTKLTFFQIYLIT